MTDQDSKSDQSRPTVSRRSFIGGALAATVFGTGIPVYERALALKQYERFLQAQTDQSLDNAVLWDNNESNTFENVAQADGDPNGGNRQHVVHVTTQGNSTTDYVCLTNAVADQGLTLSDIEADESLTYDYYVGSDNQNATPDEVFLDLRDPEGTVHVAYRTFADESPRESWVTNDVSANLDAGEWRSTPLEASKLDFNQQVLNTSTEGIVDTVETLKNSRPFDSVIEKFGENTELLGISIGNGWTTTDTVVDIYYNELVVNGQSRDIPATLVLSATPDPARIQQSTNTFAVQLTLDEGSDLSLEDLDPTTVKISPYTTIAPPAAGTDIEQAAVSALSEESGDITEEWIRIGFSPADVANALGSGSTTALVFGEFDVDWSVRFAAPTNVEIAPGRY